MSVDVQINEARRAQSVMTLPSIPPLENGDYLTRDEFERRYEAMPELKKAELIEGRVYLQASVRLRSHAEPHASIAVWLGIYSAHTSGVEASNNASLRLDEINEPQPDVLLRLDETAGGQTAISPDDFLEGVPELVVEVCSSRASYDLREKKEVYRRNGVQEYIAWQTHDRRVDWLSLEAGEYAQLNPDGDGIIRSRVFERRYDASFGRPATRACLIGAHGFC